MKHKLAFLTLGGMSLLADQAMHKAEAPAHEHAENRFAVYGDFLYWKANVDGMDLATIAYPQNQKVIFMNGEWKPGFRVGLGWESTYDEWGVDLTWTHYRGKSHHKHIPVDTTSTVYSDWNDLLAITAQGASGHWNMKLNLLDLTLNKWYKISPKISFAPFIGVRGEWIDLDLHTNYFGNEDPTSFHGNEDVKGIGIRFGTEMYWQFSKCFGIFGDISTALLTAKTKIKETFNALDPRDLPMKPVHYKPYAVHGDLEMLLGLRYKEHYESINTTFSLIAGYEYAKFFDLNQLFAVRYGPVFPTASTSNTKFEYDHGGDLDFQGLTIKARFDF